MRAPLTWMLVYSPTPALHAREKRVLNFGIRIGDIDQWNGAHFTGALDAAAALHRELRQRCSLPQMKASRRPVLPMSAMPSSRSSNRSTRKTASELTDERDRFGLRAIELAWQLSDTDLRTLRSRRLEAGKLHGRDDVGRLKIVDWLLNDQRPNADQLWGGNHHMGTTRMSDDPKQGVVDRNAKVHSLENLYIGGSSVFSTSGHANPTYTIVQLALRLGDHLSDRAKA